MRTRHHLPGRGFLAAALLLAPAAAAQPPLSEAASDAIEHGKRIFEVHCARCHGLDGVGGEGPNLMRENLRRSRTDAALIEIVDNGIAGTDMPGHGSLNTLEIRNVSAYVRSLGVAPREDLPGDPAAGRELYAATLCDNCHVVNGQGIAFGPDLSEVGMLRGSAYLREAIADPSAFVSPRYRTVLVEDAGGAQIMGVRMNEDTFSIQLLDEAGRIRSFRKNEVREVKRLPDESLMMSYEGFTDTELDDLVAYLATLRGAEGNDPE